MANLFGKSNLKYYTIYTTKYNINHCHKRVLKKIVVAVFYTKGTIIIVTKRYV